MLWGRSSKDCAAPLDPVLPVSPFGRLVVLDSARARGLFAHTTTSLTSLEVSFQDLSRWAHNAQTEDSDLARLRFCDSPFEDEGHFGDFQPQTPLREPLTATQPFLVTQHAQQIRLQEPFLDVTFGDVSPTQIESRSQDHFVEHFTIGSDTELEMMSSIGATAGKPMVLGGDTALGDDRNTTPFFVAGCIHRSMETAATAPDVTILNEFDEEIDMKIDEDEQLPLEGSLTESPQKKLKAGAASSSSARGASQPLSTSFAGVEEETHAAGVALAAVAAEVHTRQVHAAGTDLECLPQQFQELALLISNSVGAHLSVALDARLQPMHQQLQSLQRAQDDAISKSDIARMKQEIISELRPTERAHAPPATASFSAAPASRSTSGASQSSTWNGQQGPDQWHTGAGQDPWGGWASRRAAEGQTTLPVSSPPLDSWRDWKAGGSAAQQHIEQQHLQQHSQQHLRDQTASFIPQQIYIRGWGPFGENIELPREEVELFRHTLMTLLPDHVKEVIIDWRISDMNSRITIEVMTRAGAAQHARDNVQQVLAANCIRIRGRDLSVAVQKPPATRAMNGKLSEFFKDLVSLSPQASSTCRVVWTAHCIKGPGGSVLGRFSVNGKWKWNLAAVKNVAATCSEASIEAFVSDGGGTSD
jgi:hypothetical protein